MPAVPPTHSSHPYQSLSYRGVLEARGHVPLYHDGGSGHVLASQRNLPVPGLRELQVLFGPDIDWHDDTAVSQTLAWLKAQAAESGVVELIVQPHALEGDNAIQGAFLKSGFSPHPHLRYAHTILVASQADDEALLKAMARRGRNGVRRARKAGLEVRRSTAREDLAQVYAFHRHTGARTGLWVPKWEEVEAVWNSFTPGEDLFLLTARQGDDLLAGLLLLRAGPTLFQELLARSEKPAHMRLPAPTLLYWEHFRLAQAIGCTWSDTTGINRSAPPDSRPASITKFKEQFGGTEVALLQAFRYTARPRLAQAVGWLRRVWQAARPTPASGAAR